MANLDLIYEKFTLNFTCIYLLHYNNTLQYTTLQSSAHLLTPRRLRLLQYSLQHSKLLPRTIRGEACKINTIIIGKKNP